MAERPFLQELDQFRLHELKLVWNIQANHLLAMQMALEASSQQCAMPLLHHADDVCPLQLIRSQGAGCVIGKAGSRLKDMSTKARMGMERLFDAKVFLETWVRVREGWSDDEAALKALGYGD